MYQPARLALSGAGGRRQRPRPWSGLPAFTPGRRPPAFAAGRKVCCPWCNQVCRVPSQPVHVLTTLHLQVGDSKPGFFAIASPPEPNNQGKRSPKRPPPSRRTPSCPWLAFPLTLWSRAYPECGRWRHTSSRVRVQRRYWGTWPLHRLSRGGGLSKPLRQSGVRPPHHTAAPQLLLQPLKALLETHRNELHPDIIVAQLVCDKSEMELPAAQASWSS
jgi:hypothetical protein